MFVLTPFQPRHGNVGAVSAERPGIHILHLRCGSLGIPWEPLRSGVFALFSMIFQQSISTIYHVPISLRRKNRQNHIFVGQLLPKESMFAWYPDQTAAFKLFQPASGSAANSLIYWKELQRLAISELVDVFKQMTEGKHNSDKELQYTLWNKEQ